MSILHTFRVSPEAFADCKDMILKMQAAHCKEEEFYYYVDVLGSDFLNITFTTSNEHSITAFAYLELDDIINLDDSVGYFSYNGSNISSFNPSLNGIITDNGKEIIKGEINKALSLNGNVFAKRTSLAFENYAGDYYTVTISIDIELHKYIKN